MKISLAWLLDFIDCPASKIDVDQLVHLFNTRTAEIEQYDKVSLDVDSFFLGRVTEVSHNVVFVHFDELKQDIELSLRSDAVIGKYYFVTKDNKSYRWATCADFDSDKDGLVAAVQADEKLAQGAWRKLVEQEDYILDVDNKSINHRPDLWGHYGIAREVAAFLGHKLKPLKKFIADQKVVDYKVSSKKDKNHSIQVEIKDSNGCSRFAGVRCDEVSHKDSDIKMAVRLLRIGSKPINMMVDLTNYVMFDIGHPMHVFDANTLSSGQVVVRKAKNEEILTILDGQKLKLRDQDIIVTDGKNPVALAGIMGGLSSGYSDSAESVFLEAAGFDAATIRKSAQHFKIRTEASMRFEKAIDSMQNITVLQRFLQLAQQAKVIGSVKESIVSVGQVRKPVECQITHSFIEQRIGSEVSDKFIQQTLTSLGFDLAVKKLKSDIVYTVVVPTYRVKKDIEIEEDILEEIVRLYGFENLSYELPKRSTIPFSTRHERMTSAIKRHLAFACRMHELRDYLFYDESFLKRLSYEPESTIQVKSSVSQNWTRLVTSLVPHLIKNIELNFASQDHMRFFEWNAIWSKSGKKHVESNSLSGIFFDKKSVDFYDMKAELQILWDLLGIEVIFKKPTSKIAPWYDQHRTAELFVGKQSIGYAGMLSESFIRPVICGQAFAFELDADFLTTLSVQDMKFSAWSKYQAVTYDISMLVPLKVSADEIKAAISKASNFVCSVELVDFFEKEDWDNQRSLTFRYQMSSHDKTLEKQEMETVVQQVEKAVKKYDAQIR